MTDKNQKYLSVKEAVEYSGKSESTIKRMVRDVKANATKSNINKRFFKFEKLPNGHEKIFISKGFIDDYFNLKGPSIKTSSGTMSPPENELVRLVSVLEKQLDEKDKTIASLLERNREQNVLMLDLKSRLELSEPKRKRWFGFGRRS